ncbi:MAG: insulinase family protein [Ruminococcaceae bacterium]|nr:insulinase family protein [Oscillospiraceae bacterium]
MKYESCILCPGAQLHVIPKDTFKTDFIMFSFTLPLARETAAEYALLPSVLCRGSMAYPTLEDLARRLDTLYNAGIAGRAHKRGEAQVVTFQLRCLEQDVIPPEDENEGPLLSSLLDTFCELLFAPLTEQGAFLLSYVDGEKKNLCEAIRAKINNKASYALSRLDEEMFAEECYSISSRGTEETVAAVTPQSLYRCYLQMLREAPLSVTYVGRLPSDTIVSSLARFVSLLSAHRSETETFSCPVTQVVRRAEHPVRRVEESMDIRQSRLCIGYRTASVLSDGDFYRFALFNELLGGCASSKLFMEVRERRGLCYDCASYPEAQKGVLYISCGIAADARVEAENAIAAQIQAICDGEITEEEFQAAKKSLVSGYREIEDSAAAIAVWYENRRAAGIDTSPQETAEQVLSCTREALADCAAALTQDTLYFLRGTCADGGEEEDYDDDTD